MRTNPDKPIAKPTTVEQFNRQVKEWTFQVRGRARARLRQASAGKGSGKGERTISPSFKYQYGEIFSTGFKFSYYLVFVHYGVGRGYIRQGGSVVRGHRADNGKFMLYRGRPAKSWREYAGDTRPLARHPHDWLDVEIRGQIDRLADLAAAYHGDKSAEAVLRGAEKLLIGKKE